MTRLELRLLREIDALPADGTFRPPREQDRRACESLLGAGYLKLHLVPGLERGYRADRRKQIYRQAKALGVI